ncbi:MAG: hypothetical protein HC890_12065 [Chloroflexaceae bacterium]|nr:hypothetical protein [Chloroflexaceae bacterium]
MTLLSLLSHPAQAASPELAQPLRQVSETPSLVDNDEAIKECLPPELSIDDRSIQERLSRILEVTAKLGKTQLGGGLQLTNDPSLSQAENQFEDCLRTKGVIPDR